MFKYKTSIQIIIFLFSSLSLLGQEIQWEKDISKDGKIFTAYIINSEKSDDDKKQKRVSYKVSTTADIEFGKIESFMRNSDNYRLFLDNTKESRKLESINEDEWLIYLYIDAPWPVADSDCIQKLTIGHIGKEEIIVNATAKPKAFKMEDVKRMNYWDIMYRFRKVESSEVEITIEASFIPASNIPKMFLKKWLPSGPEKIISKLIGELVQVSE